MEAIADRRVMIAFGDGDDVTVTARGLLVDAVQDARVAAGEIDDFVAWQCEASVLVMHDVVLGCALFLLHRRRYSCRRGSDG